MILTEALRLYCKKNKITVRKLASETGLAQATAAAFLRNEMRLGEENFAKLLVWAMQELR